MSLGYIRSTYGVPAKRGGRVIYTDGDGLTLHGRITSARSGRLLVRLDDTSPRSRFRYSLHPTWNVEYLDSTEGE